MTADINIGDNYQLDEDSTGDLLIKDSGGNIVLKHDESENEWLLGGLFDTDSNDIEDDGQTVWDTSSQEIPDTALGTILNSTLANDTVTLAGQSVALGGSNTLGLSNLDDYNLGGNLDGGSNDITNLGSLQTDNLDIGSADFVSSGDVVPVAFFSMDSPNTNVSVSSSNYQAIPGNMNLIIQWDDLVPSDVTGVVNIATSAVPGSDETYTLKMQNNADGESMVNLSTLVSDKIRSGWTTYTPTTTGSAIRLFPEHKTEPASNSSSMKGLVFAIGWQL